MPPHSSPKLTCTDHRRRPSWRRQAKIAISVATASNARKVLRPLNRLQAAPVLPTFTRLKKSSITAICRGGP